MSIKNLAVQMPGEMVKKRQRWTSAKGEILGIGGLAGQGKIGIPNGVMGLYPAEGEVSLLWQAAAAERRARLAERAGLAMVSEDRRGVGLLLDQSIEDNIAFSAIQVKGDYLTAPGAVHAEEHGRAIRKTAQQDDQGAGYPLHVPCAACRNALRRQPAEGVHRARAGAESEVPVRLRADARH